MSGERDSGVALQTRSEIRSAEDSVRSPHALTHDQLIEFYRLMYLSRRTDDREIVLKRQQKIFFQISCAGHEALLVAAGMAMKPGYDWFFPYYRDRAICLALGNTVEEQLLQSRRRCLRYRRAADARCPRTGPANASTSSPHLSSTATQCLHAVGCAEAGRYFSHHPEAARKRLDQPRAHDYRQFKDVTFHGDEVVYCLHRRGLHQRRASSGRPSTPPPTSSSPSSSSSKTTATPSPPRLRPTLPAATSRGSSPTFPTSTSPRSTAPTPIASYAAMVEAVAYCRAGQGPRRRPRPRRPPYSHSMSEDERDYRSRAETRRRRPPRSHIEDAGLAPARRHPRRRRHQRQLERRRRP